MPKQTDKRPSVGVHQSSFALYRRLLVSAVSNSGSPSAKFLEGRIRSGDFSTALEWSERVSPQLYGTSAEYYADAQIAALIKKYPFSPKIIPGIAPEQTALKKFAHAEHRCKRYNQRFRALRGNKRKPRPYLTRKLNEMRQYIARVLGPLNIEAILDKCDVTGGASLGIHGNSTHFARKILLSEWTSTATALPYAVQAMWRNIHMRDCILPGAIKCYDYEAFEAIIRDRVRLVSYNKIDFVPKTARTHRAIAIEPLLNGFLQKGTDLVMRTRLRRIGIDLTDQDTNANLARIGSAGGFNPYVTIDLSAASDSLSLEVVRRLLPPEWFQWLCAIRSPGYVLGDSTDVNRFEKFCTMGNGFCFPLETLIFAASCHAAGVEYGDYGDDFSVYGDDIIVRQNLALVTIELLREIGFTTNVDKTFIFGPFRESCGSDWYEGQDVRPVVWDDPLTDVRGCHALHNSTYRSVTTEAFFTRFREVLRQCVPSLVRPGWESGDTCYSVPLDVAVGSHDVLWDRELQTWTWEEIISIPIQDKFEPVDNRSAAVLYVWIRGGDPENPFALRYTTKPLRRRIGYPFKQRQTWFSHLLYGEHVSSVRKHVAEVINASRYFCPRSGRLVNR